MCSALTITSGNMRRLKTNVIKLALSLGLIMPLGVIAQEVDNEQEHGGPEGGYLPWGVGVAVLSNQKAYTDIDRDIMAIPLLSYENEYIKWYGLAIDFKLPSIVLNDSQQIDFSIAADYDFGGYDNDEANDTPILNGMDERDGGYELGAKIEWKTPWVDVSAKYLADVSGDRNGSRFSIGFERNWMFGQHFMVSPHLEVTWMNDNYVDHMYGVRSHEVRANRPLYVGKSTFNIEYGIMAIYMFDMHNSLFLNISATSLGDKIQDSPITDSSTENSLMLAYAYYF